MLPLLTLVADLTSTSASPTAWNHSLTLPNASFGDKTRELGKVLPGCSVQIADDSNKHQSEKLSVCLKGHTTQTICIPDGDHRPVVWYQEIKVDIFVAES